MKKINVLQFICPSGLFGAEMWILALGNNIDPDLVNCELAVTHESENQNIELYHRYEALGLPVHKISMNGRFDFRVVGKLARLLKERKIDIIHSHGYKSDILGLLAARWAGKKALATPHGFENANDLKLQLFIRFGNFSLKHFDNVTPLSDELMEDMKKLKIPDHKVRLIQNGVDLKDIENEDDAGRKKPVLNNGTKKIGYVGQLISRKNITDLIKTFDLLFQEEKNIQLILIGEGCKRKELEDYAKTLPSSNVIDFMGYRKDRIQLLRELDLFCMTSSLEGIPRCMMEAMALEVPTAAFNIPGVDKLIIHGKTGLMAKFGDVTELKKCFKRLLSDREFARQLGENGRKHVNEHFSAARMANEYMEQYREILEPR